VAEPLTIDRVTIPQHPPWRGIIRKGVDELLCRPRGGGMLRDIDVDNPPTLVGEQHEDEQHTPDQCREYSDRVYLPTRGRARSRIRL
jgi:hypothetical protein